jgi:hypothetical protein
MGLGGPLIGHQLSAEVAKTDAPKLDGQFGDHPPHFLLAPQRSRTTKRPKTDEFGVR